MTPSGIESATFRIVEQCLNQLRHQQRSPVYSQAEKNYSEFQICPGGCGSLLSVQSEGRSPWSSGFGSITVAPHTDNCCVENVHQFAHPAGDSSFFLTFRHVYIQWRATQRLSSSRYVARNIWIFLSQLIKSSGICKQYRVRKFLLFYALGNSSILISRFY